MRLTQPMFLSFLSFKNQKPDFSKLGSETYTRKMKAPLFHNRICKVCSLVAATLILPALAYAQNNQGDDQGNAGFAIPNGTYSFRDDGQVTVTPPGSSTPITLLIAAAGRITFIPTGTMNGLAFGNTSGVSGFTAGGQVFSVTFTGMFNVNADGSVSASITLTSINPPFTSTDHLILYPSPDGNTIAFRGTDPGGTSNGVMTRH